MRNQLLRDTDVMSMRWGVELRVPFLDAPLFDTLARIPAAERLAPGKALLLAAVPEVPDWVASRPKRGFLLPMAQWLDGAWAGEFATPQRLPPIETDTWSRKWAVLAFERWAREFGVKHG
jgi:asparagine synthase (glutamine-hydrolysing)